MKKFMVYIDDGRNAMRIAVPAENAKAAKKYAEGNGEIERDLVMRTLLMNRIAE